MKNHLLLIVILSLFLVSCKKPAETDLSLNLEEYLQLGMPEYTHAWNMEDYSNAFYVLNTLKYENPKALPVRESEKSGVLFSRMISRENLVFLHDNTLPLHAKADLIKWFVNTLMELKVAYTNPGLQDQYYIRELIDIDIFRLSVAHEMLDLGNLINESDDPSDVDMKSDYPQIRQMYLNILSELYGQQQYTSTIPLQTLELLSDSLSSSVKANMHWFDEHASAMIKQTMLTVMDNSSSKKIKNDCRDLIEIL